jgi:hypothetical protein
MGCGSGSGAHSTAIGFGRCGARAGGSGWGCVSGGKAGGPSAVERFAHHRLRRASSPADYLCFDGQFRRQKHGVAA